MLTAPYVSEDHLISGPMESVSLFGVASALTLACLLVAVPGLARLAWYRVADLAVSQRR